MPVNHQLTCDQAFFLFFPLKETQAKFNYRVYVPKVRSSDFMHYNFWSKLYFYMKLLEDVYFSIKYMYSEFQLLACPFCFFITFCSRCGMNWDTMCRPTNDPLWAFFSPGAQDPVQRPNKIYLVEAAEKNIFWEVIQKNNHSGSLSQEGFCTSLQIWNELGVDWQTKQRFFCHLRGL